MMKKRILVVFLVLLILLVGSSQALIDLTGTQTGTGSSFSGKYTDLDFSGTTGLSDGVDNVSAGGGGSYDQDLNTTDSPSFTGLTLNGDLDMATHDISNVNDLEVENDIILNDKLEHLGDSDTYLDFNDNQILLYAGGLLILNLQQTGLTINSNVTFSENITGNGSGLAIDWNNLYNVPSGFADNIDNTSSGGGGYDQDLNTTDDVTFNKVSANDWSNVTINKSQISDFNITYTNKWFVSQEIGNDSNNGTSESDAFLTIERAISECSANDMVEVLDSAMYTLSSILIIPSDVTVLMPSAGLSGEIELSSRSRIIGLRHLCSNDSQTMVTCNGDACSYYSMKSMTSIGYENIVHFRNGYIDGHVMADIARIDVNSTSVGNGNVLVYSQAGVTGINIATDTGGFSSDKALGYGTPADLVYGDSGYCQWYIDTVGLPITITYDDGNAYTASSYKMKATSSGTRMPKDWVVDGQLAGGGWVTLDTQTGITWGAYEEKEFSIAVPSSYDEYRIVVSLAGHATRLQIDDIGFWAGIEGVGGTIYLNAHYCLLGDYAKGILSHDTKQNIISNINSIEKANDGVVGETFIEISNGTVNHRGNVVNVTEIWNKTGGNLSWNVAKYLGNTTGTADYKTLTNKDWSLSESDPWFNASVASTIVAGNITNWDNAFSWGNHSLVGYLLSESDPYYFSNPSGYYNASTLPVSSYNDTWINNTFFNISFLSPLMDNWNESFSWGNHAIENYLDMDTFPNTDTDYTDDFDGTWGSLTGVPSGFDDIDNTLYNITRIQNSLWSPGWVSGGTLIPNGNETITVSNGSGYAYKDGNITRVDWSTDISFGVFPSQVVCYIFVNDTGVISQSISPINDSNILLGAAFNFSGGVYVWNIPTRGKNVDYWQTSFMERAIGPLVQQGCSVTVNGTLMPTVQSGSIFTSLNNYTTTEQTIFYRGYTIDDNVTWIVESINNSVNVEYYDSPAGLALLGDKWKKDMLAIDFINNICYLGYGQTTYDNESDAINGVCPSFPEIFNSVTVFVCTFTVNSSVTALDGHVQDVRPYLPRLFGTVPSTLTETLSSVNWNNIIGIPAGFDDDIDDVGPVYYADNTTLNLTGSVLSINTSIFGDNLLWDGTYLNATEEDPWFNLSLASTLLSAWLSNWNESYSWGNHSLEGYLTTESDPIYSASNASSILGTNISNWDEAYSWGNHSLAGYFSNESEINLSYVMFDDTLNHFDDDDLNSIIHNITETDCDLQSAGWVSGGLLQNNWNGTINVTAGTGYVFKDGHFRKISWDTVYNFNSFTDQTTSYIYVNSSGVVIKTLYPGNLTNIFLGAVYNMSGTCYVWNLPIRGAKVDYWQSAFMNRAIGAIVEQGCGIVVNDTLNLTIQSGVVYTESNKFTITEHPTFYRYYTTDNNVSWTMESMNSSIDVNYYDSPTGLSLLGDSWKKDLMCIDFSNDVCYYIYGQETYDNESEATNGVIPTVPAILDATSVYTATFVVNSSVTSLIGHASDVRPYFPRLFGVAQPAVSESSSSVQWDDILGKPTLFSGSYDDLTNKPTNFNDDDLSDNTTDQLSEGVTNFWATLTRIRLLLDGQWLNLTNITLGTKSISETNITTWDSLHPYYADNVTLNLTESVFSINNSIWGENLNWDGTYVNATGGGGGGTSYDQSLNTTDNVTFVGVTTQNVNISNATLVPRWNMYVDLNGTLVWEMIP
jgi:hypothetical protein